MTPYLPCSDGFRMPSLYVARVLASSLFERRCFGRAPWVAVMTSPMNGCLIVMSGTKARVALGRAADA
jgi:hypothetical protein